MEFVRRTIEINGCKLSLARGGKGVPLMYLHGTDGLADWPAILDTLTERFDVIVPDHPGFGASEARRLAVAVSSPASMVLNRVEGRTGSFSRIVRRIWSKPEASSSSESNGVLPVSSS